MKNFILILAISIGLIGLNSCSEENPGIDCAIVPNDLLDTSYLITDIVTPDDKVVLVEDFTGVQCVNCPDAHEATSAILAAHPTQVAIIAEHNYFAGPFSESNENYDIAEAAELNDYLGPALGWPAGIVDRKIFGSGIISYVVAQYALNVDAQLSAIPPCNILIEKVLYDAATRDLIIKITITYSSATTEMNHLSVMLCESNIIDLQLTSSGIDVGYIHNHVLRDMFTTSTGISLNEENSAGRVYQKEFLMNLPENWNENNLELVAFVHNFAGNKEVLQVAKIDWPF